MRAEDTPLEPEWDDEPPRAYPSRRDRGAHHKRLWVIGGLITAALALAIATTAALLARSAAQQGGGALPPQPADNGPSPATTAEMDLQTLAEQYNNAAKADSSYTGRRVALSGYVKKVEKTDRGDYRVRFEYFVDGINWAEGKVVAIFPAAESSKLSGLEYRSPIRFDGRCDGLERTARGEFVVIRECRTR